MHAIEMMCYTHDTMDYYYLSPVTQTEAALTQSNQALSQENYAKSQN